MRGRSLAWARLALIRLLTALSLAVGVAALLFVIFESGWLGDPAVAEAGRGASPRSLAEARLRLEYYRGWREDALQLRWNGAAPVRITVLGDALLVRTEAGAPAAVSTAGRGLGAVVGDLEALALPGARSGSRVAAGLADPALAGWPARTLLDALALQPLQLAPGAAADLRLPEPRPALTRFLSQTGRMLAFRFGDSSQSGASIAPELGRRALISLSLTLPAFLLSTALAICLALLAAALRGAFDKTLLVVSAAGMSITVFAYILFLQRWLAAGLGWFPITGWSPPYLPYLALPVIIWVLVSLGPDVRFYRTVMLEQTGSDCVRTARAKGLAPATVLRRHVLRNALLPVLTQVGVALPFLFLGSLLLERFFGIPGLGGWTVQAVLAQDQAVLRATTFLFAMLYLAAQWLTDLAYAWADPRVRRPA